MAGNYQHVTLQELVDQLAHELGDPSKRFFVNDQLLRDVRESLRVWNALTGFHRETVHFKTVAGTAFYDLASQLSGQLSSTITDRDILGDMQYRLMEPQDPIDSTGISEMFTHAGMVRNIQQRRNRFLVETGAEITNHSAIHVNAGDGIVQLDAELSDSVVSIERAVWRTANNYYYNLTAPTDESAATSMIAQWRQSPGIPRSYSIATQPNLTLQLIPPPIDSGELLLMTVNTGANLDTAAGSNGTVLGVHDDTAWAIGWGALEDLLMKDGIGRDPARAQFCGQLYTLGVDLCRTMPSVLGVAINDRAVEISSVSMLDTMRAGWQGRNYDRPQTPALIGDWLALYPVPDDEYDISVTVVSKTPTITTTAFVSLSREQIAGIVGWAKQLALFKCQGVQLQQGIQKSGKLIEQARLYNEQRIQRSSFLCDIYGLSPQRTWKPVREAKGVQSQVEGESDPRDTASSRQSRNRSAGYENPRLRIGGR